MTKLEEELLKLGYKPKPNKCYYYKSSNNNLILLYVNSNTTLIDDWFVEVDGYITSVEQAKDILNASKEMEKDLNILDKYKEGSILYD